MAKQDNANLNSDEIVAIVSRRMEHVSQKDRNQILEILLEIDKDKTAAMLRFEKLKFETLQSLHVLERQINEEHKTSQVNCQQGINKKIDGLEEDVKNSSPNYFAIIALILGLFLPFLGWVFSIQQSVWDIKVKSASHEADTGAHARTKNIVGGKG